MKTFRFRFYGTASCDVDVEAESKEEAIRLAKESKEDGNVYNETWDYEDTFELLD